jgi:hypothetical protein
LSMARASARITACTVLDAGFFIGADGMFASLVTKRDKRPRISPGLHKDAR